MDNNCQTILLKILWQIFISMRRINKISIFIAMIVLISCLSATIAQSESENVNDLGDKKPFELYSSSTTNPSAPEEGSSISIQDIVVYKNKPDEDTSDNSGENDQEAADSSGTNNDQSSSNTDSSQEIQTSSHSNGGSSGSSSNSRTIPDQNKEETNGSKTAPEIGETDNETNESSFTDILDSFYRIPDDDPSDNHHYTRSHYATIDDGSEGISPLYYVLVIAILIISYFVAIDLQNRLRKKDTESKEVETIDVKRISKREEIIYIPKKKTVSEFFEQ